MKTRPDYKNWTPTYMIVLFSISSVLSIVGFVASEIHRLSVLPAICFILITLFVVYDCILISWHRAFSWNGKRKMARQIIDGTASHVTIPEHGVGLDVGCGSGALTIACAKKNPNARMIGVDIWSGAWSNYSQKLCERNAVAENIVNATFEPGNALNLPFEDETFDAVTSNFVYHNIYVRNRQDHLLETLRVLKKGGTFVIHDIFSMMMYGDMDSFVRKLKEMGYQDVGLISTTDGGWDVHDKERSTEADADRLRASGGVKISIQAVHLQNNQDHSVSASV